MLGFSLMEIVYFDSNFKFILNTPVVFQVVLNPINTLRLRQNPRHFADDLFKSIFKWKCMKFV